MYGNCGSCGFPISLKNASESVKCPYCETINTPVSGISSSTGWVLLAVAALGILILIQREEIMDPNAVQIDDQPIAAGFFRGRSLA